jgi:prevent-host-death family protein
VYTVRSLRANLRAAIAAVRETGVPAVIAERGERPVAVLVDYARWAAQPGGQSGADAILAEGAERVAAPKRPSSQRETRSSEERVQPQRGAAPPLANGWGGANGPRGPETGEQAPIPAGWRAEKRGWGA